MYKKFIAIDQYGNKVFVNHPRKELAELHGVQHVEKVYRHGKNGVAIHIGYVVSGHWYEVLSLNPFKK